MWQARIRAEKSLFPEVHILRQPCPRVIQAVILMYQNMYAREYVYMYVCICGCMHVLYICINSRVYAHVSMYVCMSMYVYVCIYVYTYQPSLPPVQLHLFF